MLTWQLAILPSALYADVFSPYQQMPEYYRALGHHQSLIRASKPSVHKHLPSLDVKCHKQDIQHQ
jgi:hypothetical protein